MADLSAPLGRLAAVAALRWHLFVNSLRDATGVMETITGALQWLMYASLGLLGTAAFGFAGWYAAWHGDVRPLYLVFIPVFFLWQVLPVMTAARFESEDASLLLRFPVGFGEYAALSVFYGALNAWTVISLLWLAAPLTVFALARPDLAVPVVLIGLLFAAANHFVSRAVLALLERTLLLRQPGVLAAGVFGACALLVHFRRLLSHLLHPIDPLWGGHALLSLPPSLAIFALAKASLHDSVKTAECLAGLAAWACAGGAVLLPRLRAQYAGELAGDGRATAAARSGPAPGWPVPGLSEASAAVFEKELRCLARNWSAVFILSAPPLILAVLRGAALSGARAHGAAPPDALSAALALPGSAAYCLLVLSNLVYNSFGAEGAGVQVLLASPASVREIVVGKNAAYAAILAAQVLSVWAVWSAFSGRPPFDAVVASVVGLLLVVPVDFAAGNMFSLLLPKKRELGLRRADKPSLFASLASLLVKLVLFGLYVPGVALAAVLPPTMGAAVLLPLAFASWTVYALSLDAAGPLALQSRDALLAELGRA